MELYDPGGVSGARAAKLLTAENSAIRRDGERGYADCGWTDACLTFSFSEYYDPRWMGYRSLRVLVENTIQPKGIFSTHPHSDMEIVTYVADGALAHKDSMGNEGVIRAGEFQRMSAGTGVWHSEGNAFETETEHNIQIWILPAEKGIEPGYEQKGFAPDERRGKLRLAVSPDGRDGSISINQDAEIWTALLSPGDEAMHELRDGRGAWVQVISGEVELNGTRLSGGDGAAVESVGLLELRALAASDILLFDLA